MIQDDFTSMRYYFLELAVRCSKRLRRYWFFPYCGVLVLLNFELYRVVAWILITFGLVETSKLENSIVLFVIQFQLQGASHTLYCDNIGFANSIP